MPTPVSALIHAATLVTAGIYLLLRSSPILEFSPTALLVITLVGATTAFFAATCGLVQNDLKRIIAMSTISQLGYYLLVFIIIYFIEYETTFKFIFILHLYILPVSTKSVLTKTNNDSIKNDLNLDNTKDKFFYIKPSINYIDKYNDFSYNDRTKKYFQTKRY
jgi:NADH:ubiquinone oxidoreductase subunit 2 (subunit N)